MNKSSNLYKLRHSAAHILAQAVTRLYSEVKLAVGPVTETGFFYDLTTKTPISSDDLPKIESEMHKIVAENFAITGKMHSKDAARELYPTNLFKQEIIDRIPAKEVSIYTQGEFFDLCEGNHTESTGGVQFFKLMNVSGSQWNSKNGPVPLQRISGIAFETQNELEEHLEMLEHAKKFDHRVLGQELDLFTFLDQAPGMAFFKPKGTIIFNLLIDLMRSIQKKYGFKEIKTPIILKEEMWHTSGHYENYKENMFFCGAGDESFCVRPMNCPCAVLTYKQGLHSYNNLPMRLAEFGLVHRYELSGTLHGLSRVRSFTQDDAHIFCTMEQLENEIINCLKLAQETYSYFNFASVEYIVSTRPEKSIGDDVMWEKATAALENALKNLNMPYRIAEGDGAFYGPKIELQIKDCVGRKWTCGTVQVDPFLPERFEIEYVDADQSRKRPIMVHRAILGSIERFFGIILEHFKGKLPLWLAPVQFSVLTISEKQKDYAANVFAQLEDMGLRTEIDDSDSTISAKIRNSASQKIPAALVIGAKEVEQSTVTVRLADGRQKFGVTIEKIKQLQKDDIEAFFASL